MKFHLPRKGLECSGDCRACLLDCFSWSVLYSVTLIPLKSVTSPHYHLHSYPVGLAYCEIFTTSAWACPLHLLLTLTDTGKLSRRDPYSLSLFLFHFTARQLLRNLVHFLFHCFRNIVRRSSGSGFSSRSLAILRNSAVAYYICRRLCGSMWPRYGSWKSRYILS